MLHYAYSNFGGYFWMLAVAVITYLAMTVVKKAFTPLARKFTANDKERRFVNVLLGIVFSVAIGLLVGEGGNFLFATNVHFMWFVGGGLLANYSNLVVRKYKDADASAFAKSFINAMNESNMDVSEADLPTLTNEIGVIVKAYADHNANSRKSKLHNVASGIAGSIEITEDEQKDLEKHITALKSAGVDTSAVDALYAKAKADGKITVAEKARLEDVIRNIHKATDI